MDCTLSVLMPAYNHEKYIAKAISSVLAQKTNFDFEILINDDCSTDRTGEIIDEFAKNNPKIKVFHQKQNIGLMKSYKTLMQNASGKYIAFLETDDFYTYENKLQESVDFLSKNDDFALIATAYSVVNENDEEIGITNSSFDKNLNGHWYEALLYSNSIAGVLTVCISKEKFFECCNIDEYIERDFKTFDLPVWLSLAANYKCEYFHKLTGSYRSLPTSISNTSDYRKKMAFEKSVDEIKDYIINKFGMRNGNYDDFVNMQYKRYLLIALGYRNFKDFRKYARLYKSSEFKYRVIHCFPTLFFLQHIIRFR